jgi:hypothetical protein
MSDHRLLDARTRTTQTAEDRAIARMVNAVRTLGLADYTQLAGVVRRLTAAPAAPTSPCDHVYCDQCGDCLVCEWWERHVCPRCRACRCACACLTPRA